MDYLIQILDRTTEKRVYGWIAVASSTHNKYYTEREGAIVYHYEQTHQIRNAALYKNVKQGTTIRHNNRCFHQTIV